MSDAHELRDQLRSLSIPRDQRPGSASARRAGAGTALLVLLVLALGAYIAWDALGRPLPRSASPASAPAATKPVASSVTRPVAEGPAAVLTATGKIVSDHRVEVATKVSGQIVALYFEQGDRVQAGQVLARLDQEGPRARRDEAAAQLARARANAAFQEVNYARVARLYESQQSSDLEFADARRALDEARAAVTAAEANLTYAEKVFRDCEVLAPIGGVILERNVEVGDFVAAEGGRGAMANSQFATIADMDKLRVEVDVSELDIGRLRPGMRCTIVPDAYKDRRYEGYVLWIDPGANYAKATVQVKVRIEQPDEFLRVEGAAQVQFLEGGPPLG